MNIPPNLASFFAGAKSFTIRLARPLALVGLRQRAAKTLSSRRTIRSVVLRSAITVACIASLVGPLTVMAPAADAATCPSGSTLWEHSGTVYGKDSAGDIEYSTTLHVVWCSHDVFPDGTVTRIVSITLIPNLTAEGTIAGWEYKGIVPGTSDGYYYNSSGYPNSGYHVFREVEWDLCPLKICGPFEVFKQMNMNVFFNGTAAFYTGSDRL